MADVFEVKKYLPKCWLAVLPKYWYPTLPIDYPETTTVFSFVTGDDKVAMIEMEKNLGKRRKNAPFDHCNVAFFQLYERLCQRLLAVFPFKIRNFVALLAAVYHRCPTLLLRNVHQYPIRSHRPQSA